MKSIIANLALIAILATGTCAPAQAAETQATAPRNEVAQGKGTVVRVDAPARIVNLRHEAIPALKWPAMNMDFKVTEARLLTGIKPGQTVAFALVKDPAAGYVISRIEAAP